VDWALKTEDKTSKALISRGLCQQKWIEKMVKLFQHFCRHTP